MIEDGVRQAEPPTGVRHPTWRLDHRQVLLTFLSLGLLGGVLWRGGPIPDPSLLEPIRTVRIQAPMVVSRQAVLAPGDTLAGVVGRLGVSAGEATIWLVEAQRHLNLRALPVGLLAEGVLDLEGNLLRLRLTPDWRSDVVLERRGDAVTGRREARPAERQLTVVRGTIRSSLFEAVDAAGETDDLALAVADIFGWDIDFHREVQPGDSFAVLCERVRADGRIVAYGPIVAATYVNQGRVYSAYRFAAAGAAPSYYDAQGRALRKLFLRAPLKMTRVTSRFSASRKHPVLGKRLPHWGVDYGAPIGTPVSVTADGTVGFVGYSGVAAILSRSGMPGGTPRPTCTSRDSQRECVPELGSSRGR